MKYLLIIIFTLLFSTSSKSQLINSFWEGPHPNNENIKFVIHFYESDQTISANGYWINNGLFNSEFAIDSVIYNDKNISFRIPNWECLYCGVINGNKIDGVFTCTNENPDSVSITRNDLLGEIVFYPLPEMKNKNFSYTPRIPTQIINNSISTIELSNVDSAFIANAVNEIINKKYGRINSLLIYKNSKLICEEYFYAYNQNTPVPIESSTKSVSSLITGIAIDKGFITSVNDPIFKYLPEYDSLKTDIKSSITIKHILTMSAGFKEDINKMLNSDDRNYYCLSRPLHSQPGEKFSYDGGSTQLLSAIVKNATQMHIDKFGEKYLFNELGINNYNWEVYKQNGFPLTSGSLEMLPRDMLKLGILVLNKGKWNNKQIVSAEWIDESTKPWINTNVDDDKYGYQWWVSNIVSDNKTYRLIWANGWGSQFIFIIPELEMVIVTTGSNHQYGNSWDIINMLKSNLRIYN